MVRFAARSTNNTCLTTINPAISICLYSTLPLSGTRRIMPTLTIRKIKRIKPQPKSQPTNPTRRATVSSSQTKSEEEDLAVLIYKTSKTARERAAAAAAAAAKTEKKEESSSSSASTYLNTTSTRKAYATTDNLAPVEVNSEDRHPKGRKRKSPEAAEYKLTSNNAPKKRQQKKCSAEGCTSQAQNGGVCIRH